MFKIFFYDTLKEWFFSNVFICFNLDHEMLVGRIEHLKRGKTLEVINKAYAVKNGIIPIKALKDARDFVRAYPFTYLCGMAKSLDQGVCKKEYLEHYAPVPKKELVILEVDRHCFFIPKSSLQEDLANFKIVLQEMDYLFSPFLLMYGCIQPVLEEGAILYAMLEHSRLCVIIMHHKQICYGKFYHLEVHESLHVASQETQEDYEQEEALLKSFLSSMEANLAQMDNTANEFQKKPPLDSEIPADIQDPKMFIEDMGHVSDITRLIQESLKDAYQHPIHPLQDFVEKVCILNTYQINKRMLEVLQNELMLEVSHMPISIVEQISIFAKREQYNDTL
ncbi:hypothetical protein ACFOPX_00725 [Helicobacter baculiformis]|uniref:Uncharacterized protein n=1 Tax=Helicobacter baculiformis TaxID=427351 RepID=A0ABV7ZFW4_9HELI|nr:hypothetical protein [Helicobacter baculiformis]